MTLGQAIDQAFMPAMCDHLEIKSISNSIQVVADAVASVLSIPKHIHCYPPVKGLTLKELFKMDDDVSESLAFASQRGEELNLQDLAYLEECRNEINYRCY